jgi:hypothetical protein
MSISNNATPFVDFIELSFRYFEEYPTLLRPKVNSISEDSLKVET